MADLSFDRLLDRIYEASVVPTVWPSVCESVAAESQGAFASLFVLSENQVRYTGTPAAERLISEFVALGNIDLNTRISKGRALKRHGFFTDYDIFRQEEIECEPFYRDFMHPRGYGWMAGTFFDIPTGDVLAFSVERTLTRGHFEPRFVEYLNQLRPHLGRAALVSARLGLERARAMAEALQSLGLPAALLDAGGKIVAVNFLFDQLMPARVQDRHHRLGLTDERANGLLADALNRLDARSIPIAGDGEQLPLIVHLIPVRGAAHDIFSRAESLVVVTPVSMTSVPTITVLQGLFDLTEAEARVARAIGEGKTIAATAMFLGLARETIRSQLKAAMQKTGVSRQAELSALLSGLALPRRPRRAKFRN